MTVISSFNGQYRWLSNFWPCTIVVDGIEYPSVEHAYQAAKTFDLEERKLIQQAEAPGRAKRLGRKVTIRPDWEQVKLQIMEDLLQQKFFNLQLRKLLLATDRDLLIEGNMWHDNFWGRCNCYSCQQFIKWQNNLGKLLMKIRGNL